ncbi:MAG: hypothetical protein HZC12_03270 [Nitrospirae bacterium]|nr:hypothetical protein [Nitrospirota bacterium]
MSFEKILKEAVERVDGASAAMILGADGITVEEYSTEKLIDLAGLGAEASVFIKDINRASETLGLGDAKEFSIISDTCGIILRRINLDYFAVLVIKPDGNYGKARFVLKSCIPELEKEL